MQEAVNVAPCFYFLLNPTTADSVSSMTSLQGGQVGSDVTAEACSLSGSSLMFWAVVMELNYVWCRVSYSSDTSRSDLRLKSRSS